MASDQRAGKRRWWHRRPPAGRDRSLCPDWRGGWCELTAGHSGKHERITSTEVYEGLLTTRTRIEKAVWQ